MMHEPRSIDERNRFLEQDRWTALLVFAMMVQSCFLYVQHLRDRDALHAAQDRLDRTLEQRRIARNYSISNLRAYVDLAFDRGLVEFKGDGRGQINLVFKNSGKSAAHEIDLHWGSVSVATEDATPPDITDLQQGERLETLGAGQTWQTTLSVPPPESEDRGLVVRIVVDYRDEFQRERRAAFMLTQGRLIVDGTFAWLTVKRHVD